MLRHQLETLSSSDQEKQTWELPQHNIKYKTHSINQIRSRRTATITIEDQNHNQPKNNYNNQTNSLPFQHQTGQQQQNITQSQPQFSELDNSISQIKECIQNISIEESNAMVQEMVQENLDMRQNQENMRIEQQRDRQQLGVSKQRIYNEREQVMQDIVDVGHLKKLFQRNIGEIDQESMMQSESASEELQLQLYHQGGQAEAGYQLINKIQTDNKNWERPVQQTRIGITQTQIDKQLSSIKQVRQNIENNLQQRNDNITQLQPQRQSRSQRLEREECQLSQREVQPQLYSLQYQQSKSDKAQIDKGPQIQMQEQFQFKPQYQSQSNQHQILIQYEAQKHPQPHIQPQPQPHIQPQPQPHIQPQLEPQIQPQPHIQPLLQPQQYCQNGHIESPNKDYNNIINLGQLQQRYKIKQFSVQISPLKCIGQKVHNIQEVEVEQDKDKDKPNNQQIDIKQFLIQVQPQRKQPVQISKQKQDNVNYQVQKLNDGNGHIGINRQVQGLKYVNEVSNKYLAELPQTKQRPQQTVSTCQPQPHIQQIPQTLKVVQCHQLMPLNQPKSPPPIPIPKRTVPPPELTDARKIIQQFKNNLKTKQTQQPKKKKRKITLPDRLKSTDKKKQIQNKRQYKAARKSTQQFNPYTGNVKLTPNIIVIDDEDFEGADSSIMEVSNANSKIEREEGEISEDSAQRQEKKKMKVQEIKVKLDNCLSKKNTQIQKIQKNMKVVISNSFGKEKCQDGRNKQKKLDYL